MKWYRSHPNSTAFLPINSPATAISTTCVAVMLMLSGCQVQQPEPPPEPPGTVVEPAAPAIPPAQLRNWLEAAETAIERDHLTYPEEGSAFAIYQQILALDPDQEDARRGLERIVEVYIQLAMRALERRQFATARSMLARARIILPDHPSIEPSAAQIRLIMNADRVTLRLTSAAVKDAEPATLESLQQFAAVADDRSCRFTISARNDAQGRWLYQQLSAGLQTSRLRAQIQVRTPIQIERLCFLPQDLDT